MSNYNFNGLTNTLLPNVYINKITLDGSDASINKLAANKESVIELHIKKRSGPNKGGWQGNPGEEKYVDANILTITYDLFLEVEELFDDIGMFVDDIFKYLEVNVMTFKGPSGKATYLQYLKNMKTNNTFPEPPVKDVDVTWAHTTKLLDNIVETELVQKMATAAPNTYLSLQSKKDIVKQKYQHTMPNGRTIYKIPVRIKQEMLGGAQPQDLAAIASCRLNTSLLYDDLFGNLEIPDQKPTLGSEVGRIATEVIIAGGNVLTKGMIFFVSPNQTNAALTKQEQKIYDSYSKNMKGQLWLGGVHKHYGRFMAGNTHTSPPGPFLDYVLVDNTRVHDFRQVGFIKKQIMNFESETNKIFGGNYINNQQSQIATADFSNLASFSNLLSTVNTKKQIKLFFCIDWGKLLKKHCLAPGVLDALAQNGATANFLKTHKVPSIFSFKVYRKRIQSSSDIVNSALDKKLVYDGFPNIYFNGKMGANIVKQELNVEDESKRPLISALVPIDLDYGPTWDVNFDGHFGHYSFTDYDVEHISGGTFEYSIELEFVDPTLSFFVDLYNNINLGVNALKPYASFASGAGNSLGTSYGKQSLFNAITGQFTEHFKEIAADVYGIPTGQDFYELSTVVLKNIYKSLSIALTTANILNTSEFAGATNSIKTKSIFGHLDPNTATPDSVNVAYDLLVTVAQRAKSLIESFSTKNIPKTESLVQVSKEKSFYKKPIAATIPKKKIKVAYTFRDPSEHVTTTDAGYEVLIDTKGQSSANIGLKSILLADLEEKFNKERDTYLPVPKSISVPMDPMLQNFDVQRFPMTFKVPKGATHLPKYIVNHNSNNENDYWMVVNNILRYKMQLYGDTDSNHSLGYGPDDKLAGSKLIDPQMERILKEYQTLAFKGIYFPHRSILSNSSEPSASKIIIDPDITDQHTPEFEPAGFNNPLPPDADGAFEKSRNTMDSKQLLKIFQVPWAQNHGQEKLLLSLINGTFLESTFLDTKLGSFDPYLKGSKISNFILESVSIYGAEHVQKFFRKMPFQIFVLMLNFRPDWRFLLGALAGGGPGPGPYAYYFSGGAANLYAPVPETFGLIDPETHKKHIQDQNMNINKFGNFWFDHMNIVEIQYLEGYEKTKKIPKIKIDVENSIYPSATQLGTTDNFYENAYNNSVKAYRWTTLDLPKFKKLTARLKSFSSTSTQKHILCRFIKTKMPFFNSKVYNALDLPLYDEYFFLTEKGQIAIPGSKYNAYVNGIPNALHGPEAFQMKHFTGNIDYLETQEISSVSAAAFEDDNE